MQIVTTPLFEKGIKLLQKKHLNDVIKDIKETIIKLANYEISTQKSNHRLTNTDVNDIHIRPNIILLYRYDVNNALIVELKLLDITDHDGSDKSLENIKKNGY